MRRSLLAPILALFVSSGCYVNVPLGALGSAGALEESTVLGESGPKIAMIEVDGLLSDQPERGRLGLSSEPSVVSRIREALDLAARDREVSAVLLRIQSPGGTVSASETIHHEVLEWKERHDKPVVAFLNGLATSGGYYVAMAADEVIAHPTAITGSIGVILAGVNLSGLMERFGVSDQSIKSGPYKDSGSPLRPMEASDRAMLQEVVDELHERFRQVVDEGRPGMDAARVAELADGRIFTARQAHELGLVDALGHMDEAVRAAERRAGIPESRVVTYHRPGQLRETIYGRPPSTPVQIVDVDLLSVAPSTLPTGFYYLWPLALPH
jgi:protease-4